MILLFGSHNDLEKVSDLYVCACLLLADCRFMRFLPSVVATATMLVVISHVEPCIGLDCQNELIGILRIDKVTI